MKNNIDFILLYLLIFNIIFSVDLNEVMNGVQMTKNIYDDFKVITKNEIDINASLTDIEKDNRYKLMFTNYINNYSMKNSKIDQMNNEAYDVFRDTYKMVEEGLSIYLKKNRGVLESEWNKSASVADYIISQVEEALFMIKQNSDLRKTVVLIDDFKNNIMQLILDYDKEQANLKNQLKVLIDLESKVSGLTEIEIDLFNNFLNKSEMSDAKEYEIFTIILSAQSIMEYKNKIYLEKKKSLELIYEKIIKLFTNIKVLINKQNELINNTSISFKSSIENTLIKGISSNKNIGIVLNEMNVIIRTGKRSPGKSDQAVPILGLIEGAKEGGFTGAMQGFSQSFVNLKDKAVGFFKNIF